ncbi:MAG TPA: hypothetical protein PLJ71_05225 [Candidatus Hydrogenedentes bacterium]|nr:hypothetical protein [Candidatus Hydrogenedentota bacterium]
MYANAIDIAAFALPNTPPNEIWFEEPQNIGSIEIEFATRSPQVAAISYWRKTWPDVNPERIVDDSDPAAAGWLPQDDWFNGFWQSASIGLQREGHRRLIVTFHPLQTEFPGCKTDGVCYRRTLGLRIEIPDDSVIEHVAVFTMQEAQPLRLRVTLDAGRPTPSRSVRLEGYFAVVGAVQTGLGLQRMDDRLETTGKGERSFTAALRYPAYTLGASCPLLTLILENNRFTISLQDLEWEPVWCEHLGILIVALDEMDPDGSTLESYQARHCRESTLANRVKAHKEQSLAGAMNGQPRPHSGNYAIGCTHARQNFRIEPNGDIVLCSPAVTRVPGRDTPRAKHKNAARFFFGLERWSHTARYPDPDPVLAYNIEVRKGGMTLSQKSIAIPLKGSIQNEAWASDDPMVALLRFRFENRGETPLTARLPIRYSDDSFRTENRYRSGGSESADDLVPRSPLNVLILDGKRVYSHWEGVPAFRCLLDTSMTAAAGGETVELSQELAPGESCVAVVKVPYVALDTEEELAALESVAFEQSYADVRAYWARKAGQGATVRTPEPQLESLHRSHPCHVYITDFEMPGGSGLVNTSVGTATYGNFTNESCMIVHDLDQRGLHDEARRRLMLWVEYQGTAEQPGNFTDYQGMFYGAGGFESGAYNQHHGWVLWCLAEHFFLTRDAEWYRSVADAAVAGADWVFRQRKNTMKPLPHSRGWEHGFLPAGSLEDVEDFHYWLSTNALTWRGVEWTARALERIGHPEAYRVRNEAGAYKSDLIEGFETMRQYAPLVRLRDGRWIPHYPSRLYRRGRDFGWIRETLEGSIYLLLSGLYPSGGTEADWILDDYQDNRYPEPPCGYLIPHFEQTWFDRAGFSIQPNLLAGLMPYLERDEPEVYLWMFYNAWAACHREELNAMVEHPLPFLGFSNAANFKTSDQANAMTWLRYMFVYGAHNLLHLGRAIPRAWFAQPEPFEARGVATYFGTVGVRFTPSAERDVLAATAFLDLDESPARLLLRFRHPGKKPIAEVLVDGALHPAFNAESGDIDLTGKSGVVEVEARYGK